MARPENPFVCLRALVVMVWNLFVAGFCDPSPRRSRTLSVALNASPATRKLMRDAHARTWRLGRRRLEGAAHFVVRDPRLYRSAGGRRTPSALPRPALRSRAQSLRLPRARSFTVRRLSAGPAPECDEDLWLPSRRGPGRALQRCLAGGNFFLHPV